MAIPRYEAYDTDEDEEMEEGRADRVMICTGLKSALKPESRRLRAATTQGRRDHRQAHFQAGIESPKKTKRGKSLKEVETDDAAGVTPSFILTYNDDFLRRYHRTHTEWSGGLLSFWEPSKQAASFF